MMTRKTIKVGTPSKDEDRKGRLPSLLSALERWIFFKVLSFHSEMVTDLTIL